MTESLARLDVLVFFGSKFLAVGAQGLGLILMLLEPKPHGHSSLIQATPSLSRLRQTAEYFPVLF